MNVELQTLALTIRFKEYLLGRDVSSRRVILDGCIQFMDRTTIADENRGQAVAWLRNLAAINDTLDSKERKEQIRNDACWDELHRDLVKSRNFVYMVMSLCP
jgi:hypothetical protein